MRKLKKAKDVQVGDTVYKTPTRPIVVRRVTFKHGLVGLSHGGETYGELPENTVSLLCEFYGWLDPDEYLSVECDESIAA